MKAERGAWFILVALVIVGSWGRVVLGAESIQTQMAMAEDVEVDVIKAAVKEGIFTVVLMYRTGKTGALIRAPLDATYYLDNSEKKKYQVLRDSKNEWIAAPAAFGQLVIDVKPGEQMRAWLKFPAPPDNAKTIDLVVPGVLPFEELMITR
jgi:hypothetical protein